MDFASSYQLAGSEPTLEPTATLLEQVHGTDSASSESTIAPYHQALNGVNQGNNLLFKDALWATLGLFAVVVLGIRIAQIFWMHLRLISCMSAAGHMQTYWRNTQSSWLPWLNKNLIYAPLWKKRHTREIKLSSAANMGCLPSRMQSVVLGIYLASNVAYMFVLNWHNENKWAFWAEVRGRSGTLAVVNMVPLIFLAFRNNPLITWLKISFDTFNLIHRWLGRLVVIETVIHTVAWAIVQVADGGWPAVADKLVHDSFYASGMIGTLALVIILITAFSPIRHAFYETFLNAHIILAFITFVCTWVHCQVAEIGHLPQLSWIIGIMILWFLERLWRFTNLAYVNWSSRGYTEAVIEAMPGEATRVTMHLPRHVDVKPGTHAYLRFKDILPWECHPFSVAWVEHHSDSSLPVSEKDSLTGMADRSRMTTSVSFVIGAQTGFTRQLFNRASKAEGGPMRLRAALEGPYGGHHSLDSYGHLILVAGSTGITHQISYLKPLIEGYNNGVVATRRITLVWIIRDLGSLEWVRPWMDSVLRLPNRKDILRVQLFVTRPTRPQQIVSASSTVQMFPGRPNIATIIKKDIQETNSGAVCVTVCGSGALQDDVRSAARECMNANVSIDLHCESFSW